MRFFVQCSLYTRIYTRFLHAIVKHMSDSIGSANKYGCAVLAGGAGKRMGGANKAALEYNGSSFLDRICSEMRRASELCYLSAANHEQPVPGGWTAVRDLLTDTEGRYIGPMGGIYSCLVRAQKDGLDGLFFAPCDAPLYTAEIHEKLSARIETRDDAVCWRTSDGRVQTTFGWYSVRCLPALREDALAGRYKLLRTLEKLNFRAADAGEAGLSDRAFLNINSLCDYQSLKELADREHILVCGKRQVGKSTLIRKVIEDSGRPAYGFLTKASAPDEDGVRHVYMYSAGEGIGFDDPAGMTAENHIGDTCGRVLSINTEVFDSLGVSLIRGAKEDGILVMDELGFMEEDAKDFCSEVLAALDRDIRVLAAVKDTDKNSGFLERVRNHPRAQLLMIDEENRDELFRYVRDIVRSR